MRKDSMLAAVIVLLGAAALVVTGLDIAPSSAADHRDAPGVLADGSTDVNDIFIFPGGGNKKKKETVMIMTTNPFRGVLSPTGFNDAATYKFNIDSDGNFKVDTEYTVEFDGDTMTVSRDGVEIGSGSIARRGNRRAAPFDLDGGGQAWAGASDDPFFPTSRL